MSAAIHRVLLNAVIVALVLLALLPAGVLLGQVALELAGGLAK